MTPELFEQYKSEAEFREKYISPLLTRLGFQQVALTHGQQEFGKDLVFAESHLLAGIRYSATQVKHLKVVTQQDAPNLLRQIQEAFNAPFKVLGSHRDAHVASVYIMNSGTYSEGARTALAHGLEKTGYGDNVRILDGHRLKSLGTFVIYEQTRTQLARLRGLENQMDINYRIWTRLKESPDSGLREIQGSMLSGLEDFIANPITMRMHDDRVFEIVCSVWERAKTIDRLCAAMLNPCVDESWLRQHRFYLAEVVDGALEQAAPLMNVLSNEISNFRLLD